VTGTLPLRRLRRSLGASLIVLAVVTGACTGIGAGSGPGSGSARDRAAPGLVRGLTSIDTLRDAFDRNAGSTRLILLISPT
jgi:hypothetical protein